MPPDQQFSLHQLWPWLGSVAGSIVSLAFLDGLNIRGRLLALLVGVLSSAFLSPALTSWWNLDSAGSIAGAVHFLVGLTAMSGIPLLQRQLVKLWGDRFGLLRSPAKVPPQ